MLKETSITSVHQLTLALLFSRPLIIAICQAVPFIIHEPVINNYQICKINITNRNIKGLGQLTTPYQL
jgi:hypothetical protein